MDKIIMSRKEQKAYSVLTELCNKLITQSEAAQKLQLSVRQVRRKFKKFQVLGAEGLIHKNRGKPCLRRIAPEYVDKVIEKIKEEYTGFGPTLAAESLVADFNLKISRETLRKVMINNGLWQAKAYKPKHRKRRPRKDCFGVMIQLDGSYHDWFEGRAPKCVLIVLIDDATSKIVGLEFAVSESTEAVMLAAQNYMQEYGIPIAFYVDHGSVFSVNTNNPHRLKLTQFENSLTRLGVRLQHAHSPQAKGRVERVNRTLQDRLVKALRLAKINTIPAANAFIRNTFLKRHNERFAVMAASPIDMHRSAKNINLRENFFMEETRTLSKDYVAQYKTRQFQLSTKQNTNIKPRQKVSVRRYADGQIKLFANEIELNFSEFYPAKPAYRAFLPLECVNGNPPSLL